MRSAWDKVSGELLEIRHGEAKLLKPRCDAGELECPVDGCPAPKLKTQTNYKKKNGTVVEDVFAHVSLGENVHTPESIRHQDGKAAIVGWQKRTGSVNVRAERMIRTRAHGGRVPVAKRRKPDVMSMLRSGVTMSFEVQTSTINAAEIRDRTRDQESAGRRVVWLFSWLWVAADRPHLDAHSTGLRELIASGDDVWFLDPYADSGAALGRARSVITRNEVTYRVRPRSDSEVLEVLWRPIDEYFVDPTGRIVTIDGANDWPDETEFEAVERADLIEAARVAAEAEAQRQAEAAKERQLERDSQGRSRRFAAAEGARQQANAAATRRTKRVVPDVSDLGSELEALCAHETLQDCHVFAPPSEWKRPAAQWLAESPVPRKFADIYDYVMSMFNGDHSAHSAVGAFVRDLRNAGVIHATGHGFVSARAKRDGEPRSTLF